MPNGAVKICTVRVGNISIHVQDLSTTTKGAGCTNEVEPQVVASDECGAGLWVLGPRDEDAVITSRDRLCRRWPT